MDLTLEATYDGKVFLPDEPINLEPNTKVELIVKTSKKETGKPYCFLEYAKSLKLEGPTDFSKNLDDYLYGGKSIENEK